NTPPQGAAAGRPRDLRYPAARSEPQSPRPIGAASAGPSCRRGRSVSPLRFLDHLCIVEFYRHSPADHVDVSERLKPAHDLSQGVVDGRPLGRSARQLHGALQQRVVDIDESLRHGHPLYIRNSSLWIYNLGTQRGSIRSMTWRTAPAPPRLVSTTRAIAFTSGCAFATAIGQPTMPSAPRSFTSLTTEAMSARRTG